MTRSAIGFLGLGQMGGAMAERLLGGRYTLHVHDPAPRAMERFAAAGAVVHDSPRSVADTAAIVFACLPSPQASCDAAFGRMGVVHGSAICVYAEMSTIGQAAIGRIAAQLREGGISTLDAPVTGGPPAARAGTLTMLVAGESNAIERVRPLLAAIGGEVHVLGEQPGMAQTMKIINNLVMAGNLIVGCEGLAIGAKAGLDPDTMLRVLKAGTGQSFSACEILRQGVDGSFDFGASLSIVEKDVHLGLAEARALDAVVPVLEQAAGLWAEAVRAGWGSQDFTTMLRFVEQRNGTVVRGNRRRC